VTDKTVGGFAEFLNYGGLGLLAILCLVVLGYNAWSLNRLVAAAAADRITAAKPLLLGQMALSLIGLLAVGGGAIYLDDARRGAAQDRMAQVLLDPWDEGVDAKLRPMIRIAGKEPGSERPLKVLCAAANYPTVEINMQRYIDHKVEESLWAQRRLLPVSGNR
jgi:hypothetical protein